MSEFDAEHDRIVAAYAKRETRRGSSFFGYRNPSHVYAHHERYQSTLRLLANNGFSSLEQTRILDVGCGDGTMLRQFVQWGAIPEHLAGIELREDPARRAARLNPQLDIRCGSAISLPWDDETFDLVCQHTVFTSIQDGDMKQQVAREMVRVLRQGGAVMWYDFRYDNPGNSDVRGVGAKEIRSLFPALDVTLERITLAPPIARWIPVALLRVLHPLLSSVPPLRTHYLGLLRKR